MSCLWLARSLNVVSLKYTCSQAFPPDHLSDGYRIGGPKAYLLTILILHKKLVILR